MTQSHANPHPHDADREPLPASAVSTAIQLARDLAQFQRQADERFLACVENMLDAFAIVEPIRNESGEICDFRYDYANRAACADFQMPLDQVIGARALQIHPWKREIGLFDAYRQVLATGKSFEREVWIHISPPKVCEIRAWKLNGGLAVAWRDITQRRIAEEALAQSEREFRAVFDRAGVGLAETDPATGRFLRVNERVCQMLGYTSQELLNMSVEQVTYPDDLPSCLESMRKLHRQEVAEFRYEKRFVRKDHSTVWASVNVTTAHNVETGSLRAIAIVRDVSERKALVEKLEAAKAAAENANRVKDDFLAVLSHELRTPLNPALAMCTSLLMGSRRLPEPVRRDLRSVQQNIVLEAHLIDDLLDVTRIARSKIALKTELVPIDRILNSVLGICRNDIKAKNISVKRSLCPHCRSVNADPARLQQILWNLIKNAVKFTPDNGTIAVRAYNSKAPQGRTSSSVGARPLPLLHVEVSDTGIGIAPDLLPRIFNAFEQGGSNVTRQFGGLGLGLAISKKLAELHGGTLTARSAGPDKGATFVLTLPAIASPPATVPGKPSAFKPTSQTRTSSRRCRTGLRILLVEDHRESAKILARLLRMSGHHVAVAYTLASARSRIASTDYQLLISDIGLPDGSGLELMQQTNGKYPGIALTGFGQDADVNATREAGFSEHLTKPVNIDQLTEAIERLCK